MDKDVKKAADNDPAKHPTSYPVEGEEPVVVQKDVDTGKPADKSYSGEGED